MLDAYIYDGTRTAFGKYCSALAHVRPDDLAATVIKALVERNKIDPLLIDDVVLGCACQSGEDSRNVARYATLAAGLPVEVSGQTVNRLCGSSLAAIIDSARAITSGEGDLFIAGGVESMTRAPLTFNKSNTAFSKDITVYDSAIGVRFPNPIIGQLYGHEAMPETADNVAKALQISREQCDVFAYQSQQKWAQALNLVFPNQGVDGRGAHVNISGGGVALHSKNKSAAVQLLEFLTDAEAQTLYSEINFEYPANPKVPHTAELQSWGRFVEDQLPILRIAELSRDAQKIIDRVGW